MNIDRTKPARAPSQRAHEGLDAAALPAVVLAMNNGEWMVALYHSDMPARMRRRRVPPAPHIAAWVVQGVERLGGEAETWWAAYRSSRLPMQCGAEWRAMWPNRRRHQTASALAYQLSMSMEAAGEVRRFPLVEAAVSMPGSAEWERWHVEVPERDLAMSRLTGRPLSAPWGRIALHRGAAGVDGR